MNLFTPDLGPPLITDAPPEEWKRRVTDYLNGLRERLDVEQIAFISHAAQLASGIVGGAAITPFTIAQSTANLATGGTTQLSFAVANSSPPLATPVCSAAGWFVSLASLSTSLVTVNVLNNSASTAGVTVYLHYQA